MHIASEWPEPSADALDASARVVELLRRRLRHAGGWLDFAEFMQTALYEPGLGYYSGGSVKFGPAGDFVTAPEVSPVFARCLARACMQWLQSHAQGVILELGAGSGVLAAEFLNALERHGLRDRRYLVLEVSGELRARQRETIARLAPTQLENVVWLDALPATPLEAVVIANEVADSLPFSRFVARDGDIAAWGVAESGAGFAWAAAAAGPALRGAVAAIEQRVGHRFVDGYRSEVCLRLPAWVHAIAGALAGGIVLLCDYGMSRPEYYRSERRDGTLTCHYRHRAHGDPFLFPGLQDITAWVDFTTAAEAADAAGLEVAGYTTQAHFLIDAGVNAELQSARPADIARAKTLLLPGEMGERIRIMALTRGTDAPAGFGFRDLRHQL